MFSVSSCSIQNIAQQLGLSVISLLVLVLALLAYLIRDWRHLMLAVSLPAVPLMLFWWLIPESPRWLIVRNRIDEAHQVLLKFAAKSGKIVDADQLLEVIKEVKKSDMRQDDVTYGVLDLVKTPKLRKRTIICFFNWFVNTVVYFGLNLNVKNLDGDLYLNFFILSIIELPGIMLCWFLLARFGRRIPYSAMMLTCGVSGLLVLAFPPTPKYRYAILVCAMVGKNFIMSTFLSVYIYTAELYPTLIRNISIGASSMMARFGCIAAPYIVMLADLPNVPKILPMVIFGVLALMAGISSLWLPETLDIPMPQTVEQAEMWPENYQPVCTKRGRERAKEKFQSSMKSMSFWREEIPIDERL